MTKPTHEVTSEGYTAPAPAPGSNPNANANYSNEAGLTSNPLVNYQSAALLDEVDYPPSEKTKAEMEAGRAALQESNAVDGRLRPHLQPGELMDPHVDPHTALYAPPYDNIRDIPNTAALDMQRKELEEAEKLAETQATLQNAQFDEMRDDWKDAQQQAKEQAELREKEKAEQRDLREKHEEALTAQREKHQADHDAKTKQADHDAKSKKK